MMRSRQQPSRPTQQKERGQQRPQRERAVEPAAPSGPSFIGGASRKRRLEIMGARGLLSPGMYNPAKAKGQEVAPAMRPSTPVASTKRAAPAQSGGSRSAVKWVQVSEESPLVLEKGYPELAPAVLQSDDIKDLLSQSTNILWEIAGTDTLADFMVLEHDYDLTAYPEVADAVKAAGAMGSEECSICLALCESQGKWAIGMAGNTKKREQAARLSLAVALAANLEDFGKLSRQWPEFTRFCETSGIATDTDVGAMDVEPEPARPAKKQKQQTAGGAAKPAAAAQDLAKLPRETPLWIVVEDELPDALAAYTPEALAVCTDANKRPGLYNAAEKALAVLVDDPEGIEYLDDYNWETFGAVGNALKKIAPSEECITVAVCPEKECWAVGVSNKSKGRWAAAKLAMAATLGIRAADEGESPDLEEFTSVREFIEEARAARDNE